MIKEAQQWLARKSKTLLTMNTSDRDEIERGQVVMWIC
jgi:hypothetical protein